jgi:hypothetical protein
VRGAADLDLEDPLVGMNQDQPLNAISLEASVLDERRKRSAILIQHRRIRITAILHDEIV